MPRLGTDMPEEKKDLFSPLSESEARLKNPVVLAYIGDTIYDLYVRTNIVKESDEHVNELNGRARQIVNAAAQAKAAERIAFTEEEEAVYKRARNAKVGTAAKNMSLGDYHKATGLEAVIGYLYLTGARERLDAIFERIFEDEQS